MRIKNGILMRTALACTMAAALLLSVSGCGKEAPTPAPETESAEQETVDLTDERTVTDVSAYRTRLDTAFADVAPVPESDVTYTVTDAGTAAVTGYTGDKTVVVIPGTLGGMTVTAVAEGAFVGSPVEALSLPDTVTDVAFGALAKCNSLSVLRTPVIACADKPWFGALFGSTSYEINRANVPNSLTSLIVTAAPEAVPDYCFYGCSALEAVSFAGLKRVGAFAFYGCDKLTCVTLPEGLETVGQYAFGNCLALAQLALPASVVRMERSMLEGCGALTALTIPFVGETADGENGCAYWIAGLYKGGEVSEGLELFAFPESDWAVFSAKGPIPESLQTLNAQVWSEWAPNIKTMYETGPSSLEIYSVMNAQSQDYEYGIWLPIKKQ